MRISDWSSDVCSSDLDASLFIDDVIAGLDGSALAVEFDPLDYEVWLLRARALAAAGELDQAQRALVEAQRTAALWPGSNIAEIDATAESIGVTN
jgi:hypothetical protein